MVFPSKSLSLVAVIVKYWLVFQFESLKDKGPPAILNSAEEVDALTITGVVGCWERDTPTWAVLLTVSEVVSAIVKDKLSTKILVVPISKVWKDAVVVCSA